MSRKLVTLGLLVVLAGAGYRVWAAPVDELLQQVRDALKEGKKEEALRLADQAVIAGPKDPVTYYCRGHIHDLLGNNAKAVADFTRVVELDPKNAQAFDQRGISHFKLGKFAESLADFDKYLELNPADRPGHWRRGITCYYAGKFEEGCKQFQAYEKFDANDVENATWHFLCKARLVGVEKAQASILKIGNDRRVPMRQIYDLYAGKAKYGDVLAAIHAEKLNTVDRSRSLFYAHLYIGLYFEVLGEKKKALEHIAKAADDFKIDHYMGEVARVHKELLKNSAASGGR